MARPRQFTDDQILDAARDLLADPAVSRPTIAQISRQSGIHTGSIYLRFPSRDELLARMWLRSIGRFHVGLIAALHGPDPLLAAAMHQPIFCREQPTEARSMQLFHRNELLRIDSDDVQERLIHVNDEMNTALRKAVDEQYGALDADGWAWVEAAVKAIPYGLIRDYIARAAPIPMWVDEAVRESSGAMLRATITRDGPDRTTRLSSKR